MKDINNIINNKFTFSLIIEHSFQETNPIDYKDLSFY